MLHSRNYEEPKELLRRSATTHGFLHGLVIIYCICRDNVGVHPALKENEFGAVGLELTQVRICRIQKRFLHAVIEALVIVIKVEIALLPIWSGRGYNLVPEIWDRPRVALAET